MEDTGLYLELKTIAIDSDPRKAVRQTVEVADRIGISVHAEINGVVVCAYPGDNADHLVSEWKLQSDRRAIVRIAVVGRRRVK